MHKQIHESGFIYVVIQDPGEREQIVGQQYSDQNLSFIPAFAEKEEALKCYNSLSLEKGRKYEVQAIHYEDLVKEASANGFMIFLLNGQGEILDKIQP